MFDPLQYPPEALLKTVISIGERYSLNAASC